MGVIRPTVVRPFESDVEQVAQVHAGIRIGATTCHQGNWSMPDAAVADPLQQRAATRLQALQRGRSGRIKLEEAQASVPMAPKKVCKPHPCPAGRVFSESFARLCTDV